MIVADMCRFIGQYDIATHVLFMFLQFFIQERFRGYFGSPLDTSIYWGQHWGLVTHPHFPLSSVVYDESFFVMRPYIDMAYVLVASALLLFFLLLEQDVARADLGSLSLDIKVAVGVISQRFLPGFTEKGLRVMVYRSDQVLR